MAAVRCIERFGAWEGYELQEWHEEQRGGTKWCVLQLRPVQGAKRRCRGCGWPARIAARSWSSSTGWSRTRE